MPFMIYLLHCETGIFIPLTLFDIGGMMPPPPPPPKKKNVLTIELKRLRGGSWNLVTFDISLWRIKKSFFWFPNLSSVTIATSLSGSTRDFLKLSSHIFPYDEILKVLKSKIWPNIWNKHPKIPLNATFQSNQWRGLGVTSIWNLGLCIR